MRIESIIRPKYSAFKKFDKTEFFGEAPAPFIGRFGYPRINAGLLTPPEVKDTFIYDAPREWAKSAYSINQVADLRAGLLNTSFKSDVKSVDKFASILQDIGMASKPVDMEIALEKKPIFSFGLNGEMAPTGPRVGLKKAVIASNPKIHTKVWKVNSDVYLKASEAVNYLYSHDFDENFLSKLLSVGSVGLKTGRKLVPTRWSITATDDMIGRELMTSVRDFKLIDDYRVYFSSYLGNNYLVLMFPEVWSYELFEALTYGSLGFSTDYESFSGRSEYSEACAGGYYTVRLAILEQLKLEKRQASCLVLRFITPEYSTPLGVWVTRETSRNAVRGNCIKFSSSELLLKYISVFVRKKFGYDSLRLTSVSKILRSFKQKKLNEFA